MTRFYYDDFPCTSARRALAGIRSSELARPGGAVFRAWCRGILHCFYDLHQMSTHVPAPSPSEMNRLPCITLDDFCASQEDPSKLRLSLVDWSAPSVLEDSCDYTRLLAERESALIRSFALIVEDVLVQSRWSPGATGALEDPKAPSQLSIESAVKKGSLIVRPLEELVLVGSRTSEIEVKYAGVRGSSQPFHIRSAPSDTNRAHRPVHIQALTPGQGKVCFHEVGQEGIKALEVTIVVRGANPPGELEAILEACHGSRPRDPEGHDPGFVPLTLGSLVANSYFEERPGS